MELREYGKKRNLTHTGEPQPKQVHREGSLTFVVQEHHARRLHYDFRLEFDGVLKSWAVPKGPSLDPAAKHLAVMVEDHPLDYASFEGVIPEGEYGAGKVIIWDNGTYSPDEGGKLLFNDRAAAEAQIRSGLEKGKLSFFLRGHKLKGSWTLVRIQKRPKDWLLMKHRDEYANPGGDVLKEDKSVVSGHAVEDVEPGQPDPPSFSSTLKLGEIPGALAAPFPSSVTPMLAQLTRKPFSSPDWIFEPKLDGYRIITYVQLGQADLISRNGIKVTEQYALLVPDLVQQPVSETIMDGEIIAMDKNGTQCFQCLQEYLTSRRLAEAGQSTLPPLVYYIFDILYLDGYDLRGAALLERKRLLHRVLRPTNQVRLVDYFEDDGKTVYKAAVDSGLEGVIAKKKTSTYRPGRSGDWLKVKAMKSDDFVIGGYSAAKGGRLQTFSSLLLGYFDGEGKLRFAGHVGTGFDEQTLVDLKRRLDMIRTDKCPFAEVPPLNAPTTWVRPELVAEVKYSERTKDGRLRIPVFLRLREDKVPAEVHMIESVAEPTTFSDDPDPPSVDGILEQLQDTKEIFAIDVEGNKIKVSNLDKVLWPETTRHPPLTKRHLLTYLTRVAPYFLPHLKDRPLTLSRYPDGIHGEHFFQKHWRQPIPDFVTRVNIREEGDIGEYLVCDNLSTLLWLGQTANLELHTWFSRTNTKPEMPQKPDNTDYLLDYPDFMVFDLDPYVYSGTESPGDEPELNRSGFASVFEVALWFKEVLDELTLSSFVKTSGKTGLHVYVPIKRDLNYKAVRSAAETIGRYLLQRHEKEITMEWAVEKRRGKVFIDYGQNVRGKTLASVYSPRPDPEAAVSTPLHWEELGKVYPSQFSILTLPDRLKKIGDLWADILDAKHDLKKILDEM